MANSRSKNAALNIIVGYIAQIGIMLLSFIGRRIFVHYLSIDYLGINGLYGNVLSVLALAEMGLGNVTQFFLYKPVANKDEKKIASLMRYFRKLYTIIAIVILTFGLLLIPFLRFIVNSNLPQGELILYYVLFLLNSVVTYFSADKIALLAANQDNRLSKYVNLGSNLLFQIIHIIILMVWRSYSLYVVANILNSLLNVVVINMICNRRYPYAKISVASKLEDKDCKTIIDSVKSTFVYKIGAVIVNNTDNILISIIVSTAAVGLYSNYYMVVSAIQMFVAIITTALISGIGSLSAEENKKRMNEIFNMMLLFYHFIAGFGAISFFFLFQDLIPFWLGADFVLDTKTVFAIALSFYVTNAISPIWMFREANGLFSKVKYLLLITAGCNVLFSVVLGKLFGVFGILLATTLARIVTQVWYEPKILFKNIFNKSAKEYWLIQGKYFLLVVISATICFFVNEIIPHSPVFMVVKAMIYASVTLIFFIAGNYKSAEGKELIGYVRKIKSKFTRKGSS